MPQNHLLTIDTPIVNDDGGVTMNNNNISLPKQLLYFLLIVSPFFIISSVICNNFRLFIFLVMIQSIPIGIYLSYYGSIKIREFIKVDTNNSNTKPPNQSKSFSNIMPMAISKIINKWGILQSSKIHFANTKSTNVFISVLIICPIMVLGLILCFGGIGALVFDANVKGYGLLLSQLVMFVVCVTMVIIICHKTKFIKRNS